MNNAIFIPFATVTFSCNTTLSLLALLLSINDSSFSFFSFSKFLLCYPYLLLITAPAAKYYVGMARPENVACAIVRGKIEKKHVPATLFKKIMSEFGTDLAEGRGRCEDFTAYPDGCPRVSSSCICSLRYLYHVSMSSFYRQPPLSYVSSLAFLVHFSLSLRYVTPLR